MREKLGNSDILLGLQTHDRSTIKYVMDQYFPMIRNMVMRTAGASSADAEDVFMNGLEAIYLRLAHGPLELSCQFSTFFYAICHKQWCTELRRRKRSHENNEVVHQLYAEADNDAQNCLEVADQMALYHQMFNRLGQRCQQILQLTFSGYSAKDIATKLSLRSANYINKRRSICRRQLLEFIQQDQRYSEITQKLAK